MSEHTHYAASFLIRFGEETILQHVLVVTSPGVDPADAVQKIAADWWNSDMLNDDGSYDSTPPLTYFRKDYCAAVQVSGFMPIDPATFNCMKHLLETHRFVAA